MILRRKLNSDDLILMYLAMKIINGYENIITEDELIEFLTYFNNRKELFDYNINYNNLIEHLLSKKKRLWGNESKIQFKDNKIFATYDFANKDIKETEIACLSDNEIYEIKNIISLYLNKLDKRKINFNINVDDNIKKTSDEFSGLMCKTIWNSYVNRYINVGKWPVQCQDINKYLLDTDLAIIINLPSIKRELILFYFEFSKRLSILIASNNNLILSNDSNYFLSYSNYLLCTSGFNELLNYVKNKKIKLELKDKREDELINNNSIINNLVTDNELKKLVKNLNRGRID